MKRRNVKVSASARKLERLAREVFGFERLRPVQIEAIQSVASGRDTLVVLPTGAGKSAIYQLAGIAIDGPTVVVSPLIALQHDQLESLEDHGTGGAAVLNSTLDASERARTLERVASGEVEFLFLAPEQFGNDDTVRTLKAAKPSLFVVDEAHCIAEWGHDFRPDYLQLGRMVESLGHPTTLALTATAAAPVREQITERLRMRNPKVIVHGFDRPNLVLGVRHYRDEERKRRELLEAIEDSVKPGIVYVATRAAAEELAEELNERGIESAAYHAGLPKDVRERVQEAFMDDELETIVATIAFGMGIDKPNVRFVYHYDVADSLDSYYQEIGRAGRDGERAEATLFFDPEDLHLRRFQASGTVVDEDVLEEVATRVARSKRAFDPRRLRDELELSDTRLQAAINRLEEVGAVRVTPTGRVGRPKDAPPPDEAARVAMEAQQGHKRYERSRVEMMRGYAETNECRRAYLLSYFGEAHEPPCDACDVCLSGVHDERPGTPTERPFPLGAPVQHGTFGGGQVVRYEGAKITVLFGEHGYQTLALDLVLERGLLEAAD